MYNEIIRFIRNLYDEQSEFIPLHEPRFIGNEQNYVRDAIESTFVSSVGAYVNKFEEDLAIYTGAKRAVAIVNGTSALHLALKAVGVEMNTEVLVQPLSFIATTNAVHYLYATPHFVDVDRDTLSLSPYALKKRLESIIEMKKDSPYNKSTGKRISACLPMHTFGYPARIDEICSICEQYNIPVVEDAAESLGTTYKAQHTGTFGILGIYSFNGNKTITSGGGGAIVTMDEELGKRIKHLSTTAKVPHPYEYIHDQVGFNYRMPNLNAALLCAQLEQLTKFIENKRCTSQEYEMFFKNFENPSYKKEPKNARSNMWLNAIEFDSLEQRNQFLEISNEKKVMTRPIWQLLSDTRMYSNSPKGELSNAKFLEQRIVNIPSSVRL